MKMRRFEEQKIYIYEIASIPWEGFDNLPFEGYMYNIDSGEFMINVETAIEQTDDEELLSLLRYISEQDITEVIFYPD